jgi:opacity protein-like surface antigen
MKKLMLLATCFALAAPAVSYADQPVRDRATEAQNVASFFGLESQSFRVLTASEADALRGTGGHGGSLLGSLGIKAKVNVKANVKVASVISVKANVSVGAKVRIH